MWQGLDIQEGKLKFETAVPKDLSEIQLLSGKVLQYLEGLDLQQWVREILGKFNKGKTIDFYIS